MSFSIQPIQKEDHQKITPLIQDFWGGEPVIVHGEAYLTHTLEGLKAVSDGEILGFYQKRGFRLTALFPGQIAVSRKLKSSIPEIGDNNIPILDEMK